MKFENRAVAFIDVLGFKNIVDEACTEAEDKTVLHELVDTLDSAIPLLNQEVNPSVSSELIPKHISISDCIILSAPLKSATRSDYSGLSAVVMRVVQLYYTRLTS